MSGMFVVIGLAVAQVLALIVPTMTDVLTARDLRTV